MSTSSRRRKPLAFIATLFFLALTIITYREHQRTRTATLDAAREEILAITVDATRQIDAVLQQAEASVRRVAAELDAGELPPEQFGERIVAMLKEDPDHYVGSTITYRPFGLLPDRKLYSAYYYLEDGGYLFAQLDMVYDYLDFEWYAEPMRAGPHWTRPYFDEASRILMVTFSMPFHEPGNPQARLGVVTVDISMDTLKGILEGIELGPAGYPAMTTADGLYLYHPVNDYVNKGMTLIDVAREKVDNTRLSQAPRIANRETAVIDHISTTTGQESWFVYAPVETTGWSLQNTFIKDSVSYDMDALRRGFIRFILAFTGLALAAGALIFSCCGFTHTKWWMLMIAASIAFAAGSSYIWIISLRLSGIHQDAVTEALVYRSAVNRISREAGETAERYAQPAPVVVPTGIHIERAVMDANNTIEMSGYVWQHYPAGLDPAIKREIAFVGGRLIHLEPVYGEALPPGPDDAQHDRAQRETKRWRFTIAFQQNFDFRNYPIDQEVLTIRMRHAGFDHQVLMVPDLESYRILSPSLLPGLSENVFFPGWEIFKSFFTLEEHTDKTDFGLDTSVTRAAQPDLAFKVHIRRNFINAVVSNLTPLVLVSILLFMILLVAPKIDVGRFMSITVTMSLVAVFSHVDVRSKLGAQQIFYLEYFYFIMYVMLFAVALIRILIEARKPPRLITYEDNFIPCLMYWPLLNAVLYVVTLVYFY
jgi:hypothetical protein